MRQSTKPVQFDRTKRPDAANTMTSGRAGVVVPVGYAPLLAGDSASGRVVIDLQLKEMPRPLRNAVVGNIQAWFVPRSALPQFSGYDEFMHSRQGKVIKALGQADRNPPAFFNTETDNAKIALLGSSAIYTALGVHLAANTPCNVDLIDAFNLIYNFRLAAHSSKLTRRSYYTEDKVSSLTLPPAFWPVSRMAQVVPDYEQALVVGQLALDITAGQVPVSGLGAVPAAGPTATNVAVKETGGGTPTYAHARDFGLNGGLVNLETDASGVPLIFAEMGGISVMTSLADIDKARTTQAFAKLRAQYAGTDSSGFDNDDVIIAELMQGLEVPNDLYSRPWLLDDARVTFGMLERHATDAANLDDSVSTGRAQAVLSINIPRQETGGLIIYTVEVMPELITERASDEYLYCVTPDDLPNALRDIQRTEPVDIVLSRRIDTAHTTPGAAYGYEPMNGKWNRQFTRLGGEYKQNTPGTPNTAQRTALWQVDIVDPIFAEDHYLCPVPFPHSVFSAPSDDAFDVVVRHDFVVAGHTVYGDALVENNEDFVAVDAEA